VAAPHLTIELTQGAERAASEIKTVYSPTHAVNIQRPDANHAVVSLEHTNVVPANDFRLFFDAAPGKLSANVLSYRPDSNDEGYFLLLASPEIKSQMQDRPMKTVIFVLDRSGSMSGKKIEQAKEAVKFVLNNLKEGDLFNIVAYAAPWNRGSPSCKGTTRPHGERRSALSTASTPVATRTSMARS
jgi:von Willebrand factor type A domain